MRKWLSIIAFLGVSVAVNAQSVYPGQFNARVKVASVPTEALCFELADVELLPSRFRDNMERDSAWMVSIGVDRLLHSFYNKPSKRPRKRSSPNRTGPATRTEPLPTISGNGNPR